jgi:hypothetical protein
MANKIVAIFAAVFLVGIVSLIGVLAYKGSPNVKGANYDAEVHEQLEAAMEAGDYNAWLKIRQDNNLPTKGRIFQVINADNFDWYVEMHNANLAGDTQTANAIREELGLGQGMMKRGSGQGKMSGSCTGDCQGKMAGSGQGQRAQQFVDANGDGICDNHQ